MNTKLDIPRELKFTALAKEQLNVLGLDVWLAIRAPLLEIAKLRRVCDSDQVCHVAQTGGEWFRYKDGSIGVRVAFSTSRTEMIVHAVLKRDGETYNKIEEIFMEEKKQRV